MVELEFAGNRLVNTTYHNLGDTQVSTVAAKAGKPIVEIMREKSDRGKIIIDPSVSYEDAIRFIDMQMRSEQQVVQYSDTIDTYPTDGANALFEVMKATYGWIEQHKHGGWFDSDPPELRSVQVSHTQWKEIPWGKMSLPGVKGHIILGAQQSKGLWKFYITAEVIKRDVEKVKELITNTRAYLAQNSIYQGHPLRLEWVTEHTFFGKKESFDIPKFMAPSNLYPSDLVLPNDIWKEVNAGIFSLIKNHEQARKMGVPAKRLNILAGPFGTGKTLTAAIASGLCSEMKRTFWYLTDIKKFPEAIHLAAQYSPSLVFGEDIDKIVDDPDLVDRISNTIDGVDTKAIDVMFAVTTNYPERLPEKLVRPGRSDLVIMFAPPDARAAAKLIYKYAGKTLDPTFTFTQAEEIGNMLAHEKMIPASIREAVERSKLFAIAEERSFITAEDVRLASIGVINQCNLFKKRNTPQLPEGWEARAITIGKSDPNTDMPLSLGRALEYVNGQ